MAAQRSGGRRATFSAVVAVLVLLGTNCTDVGDQGGSDAERPQEDTPAAAEPIGIANTDAWRMHPIDGRYRGANALGSGDVDQDGFTDYITNYEFDQRWIVALHPGEGDDVFSSWPTVQVWGPAELAPGNGSNPESSALGDVDGDGNVDAVGAHGYSDLPEVEGSAPGVHVVWGPDPAAVTDPSAWVDGGWIPATVDLGHPHWIVTHDLNGDGLLDIVYGGRMHGGGGGYDSPDSPQSNGTFTGISWLEAPDDPAARRDLSAWELHHIDADQQSGHGFVLADLDGDGDDDIVDANADFDTPEEAEEIVWYANPGDGTDAQRDEWAKTTLLRDPTFYAKPSVAVGDIDGDGTEDIVTQTAQDVIAFRGTGEGGFEQVSIPKEEVASGRARGIRLADMDSDGDLDILGFGTHEDGDLPADRASVFLMLNEGDPWGEGGWDTLPIKWGPGRTMRVPGFGEKWDQVDVTDVDGDGDLDVVANNEEWWVEDDGEIIPFFDPALDTTSVAVVWFENRLGAADEVVAESDAGTVAIEAERPTRIADSTWVERLPVRGDESGAAAVQVLNALPPEPAGPIAWAASEGNEHTFEVDGGEYSLWARIRVPASWGYDQGGALSDSLWVGVLDAGGEEVLAPSVLGDDAATPADTWTWVRLAEPVALEGGEHTLTSRARERGLAVDAFVLSADPSYVPT